MLSDCDRSKLSDAGGPEAGHGTCAVRRRGLINRVVPIRPQPGFTQRCENMPDAPPHPFRCFSILWETDRKEGLAVRGYVDDTPACARIKEILGPLSRWPLPRPVSDQLFPQCYGIGAVSNHVR